MFRHTRRATDARSAKSATNAACRSIFRYSAHTSAIPAQKLHYKALKPRDVLLHPTPRRAEPCPLAWPRPPPAPAAPRTALGRRPPRGSGPILLRHAALTAAAATPRNGSSLVYTQGPRALAPRPAGRGERGDGGSGGGDGGGGGGGGGNSSRIRKPSPCLLASGAAIGRTMRVRWRPVNVLEGPIPGAVVCVVCRAGRGPQRGPPFISRWLILIC
jgi:hypothetical protein